MLVGVPATLRYPLGLTGLFGCPAGDTEDSSGSCWASDGAYDGFDPNFVVSTTPINTPINPASCPQGVDLLTGACVTTGADYTPAPTVTSYPAGNTAVQNAALLAAITSAGNKALNAGATPYLIPGTNSVYNPATGAITAAAPTPSSVAAAAALQTSSLTSSLIPIAMIGAAVVVVMMMMNRK